MKIILFMVAVLSFFGLVTYNVKLSNKAIESVPAVEEIHPADSPAEEKNVRSKNKPLVLVELFTSEGCSSCPPADKNLTYLNEKQPFADAEVIALSMHVDYWNRLGWKDPFSSAQFSERQSDYSNIFNLDGVYTPQMVVDGRAQFVGSNFEEARKAVNSALKNPKANIELALTDNKLQINITDLPKHSAANVFLAVAENNLTINVKNGENGGRTLSHTAVVRDLKTIGELKPEDNNFKDETPLQLNPQWKKKDLKLVVFVQNTETGQIIGVNQISL
jgi:hypothetical protein